MAFSFLFRNRRRKTTTKRKTGRSFFSFLFSSKSNPPSSKKVSPPKKVQKVKAPSAKTKDFYRGRNRKGLSAASERLILDYEVGGGQKYYDRYLRKPCVPGAYSGVTVGVGYDLGYKSVDEIKDDWTGRVSRSEMDMLLSVRGLRGKKAKDALGRVSSLRIDWDDAYKVYKEVTIPRFIDRTKAAFPGVDACHPHVFGALVSLVFNRGGSMNGSRRAEMINVRNLVQDRNYPAIADQIRAMKRLWDPKKLRGLHLRRDAEAKLVDSAAGL